MIITNQLLSLPVVVDDIATVIVTYNRLLVYRSTTGVSGAYSEITAPTAGAATLTGAVLEPFVLNGKEFALYIDGTEETFIFGAVITAAAAAAEIAANTSATAADASGYVKVDSPTTGTASTLEFQAASEAGVALGFYAEDAAHGTEARATLVAGTKLYTVYDYQGSTSYWYKTQYYHTGTHALSALSAPFQGREEGSLDPAYIIYGTGYLVAEDGTPLSGVKVAIYNRFVPTIVDNKIVAGIRAEYVTSATGYVIIPMVKGSTVELSIEGTPLRRTITVPSSGDTFDLMTPAIQDSIGIVEYDLTDALRTTL